MAHQKLRRIKPSNAFPIFCCPILSSVQTVASVSCFKLTGLIFCFFFVVVCSVFPEMLFCILGYNNWLFELPLPPSQLKTVQIFKAFKKASLPRQLPLTGQFLFFWSFSVNPTKVEWENPSRSAVFEIIWFLVSGHVQSHFNQLSSPF